MVNQHTIGLDSVLHKEGCLFLVYLWAGWLWDAVTKVAAGKSVDGYDAGAINALFGQQKHIGSVAEDATVLDPVAVVRAGGRIPDTVPISVDYVEDNGTGAAVGAVIGKGPFIVDAVRYTLGQHQHFVGHCLAPQAYFDPWIASRCVAGGLTADLRRVSIGAADR